jgi:hypothetical protein
MPGEANNMTRETIEKRLPGGGVFRCTTLVTPQEELRREAHGVMEEGLVQPTKPGGPVDVRVAVALAASRICGIKLANPQQQERAIALFREGRISLRRAIHVGLADLLVAIGSWKQVVGPGSAKDILRAARRYRRRFVLTDAGWHERDAERDAEPPADVLLDVDVLVDESVKRWLEGLTSEERHVFALKLREYGRKEAGEILGWPERQIERVWRALAAGRRGRTLRGELMFWASSRGKVRPKNKFYPCCPQARSQNAIANGSTQ